MTLSKYMGRKFINRYKNENYDQEYEEEPEESKKKMERIGPNIDDVDAMDVEVRQITLEKNIDKPKSREDIIKEELQVAGHQTRTTNQFQKYINAHIEDRLSRIDKIKQAKQAFDKDIEALKGDEFQYLPSSLDDNDCNILRNSLTLYFLLNSARSFLMLSSFTLSSFSWSIFSLIRFSILSMSFSWRVSSCSVSFTRFLKCSNFDFVIEWSHITNSQNPNIDDVDVMDVQDRSLFFNDEAQTPQTNWEKTKEATRNAMDKAGNTGQYIKYVNAHFEKKNSEINKIKALKHKFDQEVNLLRQSTDPLREDDNPNHFISDKKRLIEIKESIQKEHEVTKAYFNELKSSISKTESELERQVNQMREINDSLKDNSISNNDEKTIRTIDEELNSLSKKYDAKTMLDILKNLEASLEKEDLKNASK